MGTGRSAGRDELIRGALRRVGVAVVGLALTPAVAAAQTTDDYWRALASESVAEVVLTAEAPPSIPEPIAEGLRLFRAWELSGDAGAARRARDLLRRARVEPEHRAWHALALAMVYARGPDSRVLLDDDYVTDPNSLGSARSLRLLRRALEARPQFVEAGIELARWALDREHRVTAAEADSVLATMPETAELLIARAQLRLLLDQPGHAVNLAEQAATLGADASVALHLRAWALLQHPRTLRRGVAAYYEGAQRMTDAGRVEYARFLEPILTLKESEEWRATPNARAADWLRRYWNVNAGRAGVLPEERLGEHYRRLQRARIEFPNVAPLSVLQQQARFALGEDSRRFGLSLQGLMLLRHGNPYRLGALQDCLADPWPRNSQGTICSGYGDSRLAAFQAMTGLARGDSYQPFVRPLTMLWDVYTFRGDERSNDIVFAIGLPVRSANELVDGPDRMQGVLSTVLLTDSGGVIRRDSTFSQPVPRFMDPLAGETDAVTLMFGVLRVPAEDTVREYRVGVSDVRRHAGVIGGGVVRTHDFSDFSLSDVVVAPEEMPAGWRRGDVDVAFAPLATYRVGETVAVYYEIYGLDEGVDYLTEIALVPPADNVGERMLDLLRDRAIRFRFTGSATAPHAVYGVQEDRTLTLEGVEPGIWTLRVRVTDSVSGRRAEREATIEVEE